MHGAVHASGEIMGTPQGFVMDAEFVKWFATLGVGGILAGVMFMFYRKDVKQYTDLWKEQSGILMAVVKENTASNTKLITVIDALHRRLDREPPPTDRV